MMPVIAHALLDSVALLSITVEVFARSCVLGIRVNVDRCRDFAERTDQLVTAVAPVIGYERAATLLERARVRQVPIRHVLQEAQVLPADELARLLDLHALARGGHDR